MVSPDSIARSLHYDRPATHDMPYLLRDITEFDANMFATTMCTNPEPMGGFVRKEFIPWKLKPKYALMSKVIHNDRAEGKGEVTKQGRNPVSV